MVTSQNGLRILYPSIEQIDKRFRSGNSVQVDRAWVPKEEWEAVKKYIEILDARYDEIAKQVLYPYEQN